MATTSPYPSAPSDRISAARLCRRTVRARGRPMCIITEHGYAYAAPSSQPCVLRLLLLLCDAKRTRDTASANEYNIPTGRRGSRTSVDDVVFTRPKIEHMAPASDAATGGGRLEGPSCAHNTYAFFH